MTNLSTCGRTLVNQSCRSDKLFQILCSLRRGGWPALPPEPHLLTGRSVVWSLAAPVCMQSIFMGKTAQQICISACGVEEKSCCRKYSREMSQHAALQVEPNSFRSSLCCINTAFLPLPILALLDLIVTALSAPACGNMSFSSHPSATCQHELASKDYQYLCAW